MVIKNENMGTCQKLDCNNKIWSHNFCRLHQWMRTDEAYKKQKEYAKQNRKPKKQIAPESKKRKKEHIRYIDQIKLFWKECVENGTNICFFCNVKSDTIMTIHHLQGRTGDYYLDKNHWVWGHNLCHVEKYTFWSIESLMKEPWYNGFLERLKEKDYSAYCKEIRRQEKNEELFANDEN